MIPCATCWDENCEASLGRVRRETHDYDTSAKWMPCPDCGVETPEAAPEIIMDANGIYWRRYSTHLSMVPVSDDNLPVPKPYVVYRRVGTDYEGGFASTATGDLLARVEAAENRVRGVETPEAAVEGVAAALHWRGENGKETWEESSGGDGRSWGVRDYYREWAAEILAQLRAQGWTPPGGTE